MSIKTLGFGETLAGGGEVNPGNIHLSLKAR